MADSDLLRALCVTEPKALSAGEIDAAGLRPPALARCWAYWIEETKAESSIRDREVAR